MNDGISNKLLIFNMKDDNIILSKPIAISPILSYSWVLDRSNAEMDLKEEDPESVKYYV